GTVWAVRKVGRQPQGRDDMTIRPVRSLRTAGSPLTPYPRTTGRPRCTDAPPTLLELCPFVMTSPFDRAAPRPAPTTAARDVGRASSRPLEGRRLTRSRTFDKPSPFYGRSASSRPSVRRPRVRGSGPPTVSDRGTADRARPQHGQRCATPSRI